MPRDSRPSQKAVSLLATAFVLLGGLIAMTFMIVASTEDPLPLVLSLAGGSIILSALFWVIRDRPQQSSVRWDWNWLRGRETSQPGWRVAIRRPRESAPPPQPPTAEQVRELSQNVNTWVPTSRPRKRPEQQSP